MIGENGRLERHGVSISFASLTVPAGLSTALASSRDKLRRRGVGKHYVGRALCGLPTILKVESLRRPC